MRRYAQETAVPVAKSRAEIEAILVRYGAGQFIVGWSGSSEVMIGFELHHRRMKFVLPLPEKSGKAFTTRQRYGRVVAVRPDVTEQLWEQACRQRWRALALVIKAKLEAVSCGITTVEEEFLSHIIMPNGKTIGEQAIPQIEAAYQNPARAPQLRLE